jgi:hemoglobin
MKNDILNLDDIKLLVDTFYDKVRKDDLLGGIFNEKIGDRWPEHLDKMYRFWQTVLLDEHTYLGSPFLPHAKLPIDEQHFNHWLALFNDTIDNLFEGAKAGKAKWQAARMAEMFMHKINYYNGNNARPVL